MLFSKISIAGRIYASFAVMIVLLALLTVLAVVGVQTIAGTLDGFRTATEEATRVRSLTTTLTGARLAVRNYAAEPTDDTAQLVTQSVAELAALGAGGDMAESIAAYGAEAASLIALDEVLAVQLTGLDAAGIAATQTLSAMIDQSSQSANLNAKAAALAGLAMENLLQLRLGVAELIGSPDDAQLALAMASSAASGAALADLRATFFKTEDLARVDSVLSALDAYAAEVQDVFVRLTEREALRGALADLELLLEQASARASDVNAARQAESEAIAAANSAAVQIWVLAVGSLSLAIGGALAFLIARWLSRTIRRLASATDRLAAGDFSVTLPQTNSSNELGQIARALEIFGANGLALQAEQLAKAEEFANQRARQEELGRFQMVLANLASAAARGDFRHRLPNDFALDELVPVVGSINQLLQTIERGLAETSSVLAAVAAADLTQRVTGDYEGAFAALKLNTNGVADRLSEIMQDLRVTSHALKNATEEILSGATDLADRTTRQALAVEETSAAMHQLSQTVQQNAAQARHVNAEAGAVARIAADSGAVMLEANAAMQRVNGASTQIVNIIGMIDDIAFQTNLLALNASVEAARAGEAGRGFAIVAIEVRRLAQSAARASADIKALIDTSVGAVAQGTRLVAAATTSLLDVQKGLNNSAALMEQIMIASDEQASAIAEAGQAIGTLDDMTQRNATLVEQLNTALAQTESQAAELDDVVKSFVLGRMASDRAELLRAEHAA
ncbi:methyl-accepting chemotaxis protein [Devosia sp. A449]